MALRIRCLNCNSVLSVADELANQQTPCPQCGLVLNVPPKPTRAGLPPKLATCPHCKHDNAPGTAHCRRCGTELASGKRPPLRARWRYLSARTAAGVIVALLLLVFGGAYGWNLYKLQQAEERIAGTPMPDPPPPPSFAALVTEFFAADDLHALASAHQQLLTQGAVVGPDLVAGLEASFAQPVSRAFLDQKRRAALVLLADFVDTYRGRLHAWRPVLADAQAKTDFDELATLILASLGDADAVAPLVDAWADSLERLAFLEALDAQQKDSAAFQSAIADARLSHFRLTRGLRRVAAFGDVTALEPVAERYWSSWHWLGQARGERYSAALFSVAFPFSPGPSGAALRDTGDLRRNVRGARRALDELAAEGSALAATAAGLALLQQSPQYSLARERIIQRIAERFPSLSSREQQRVTWGLTQLTGRPFATFAIGDEPEEVDADVAAAVYRWITEQRLATVPTDPPRLRYPREPEFTYRVLTDTQRLERRLLAQFGDSWSSARSALRQWLATDIGVTPRLSRLLDPGQTEPNLSALASALVIVGVNHAYELQGTVELWQHATDQPAWIQALAYVVHASWDSRRAEQTTDWPQGLDLTAFEGFADQDVRWEYFGRVLAAGSPAMISALTEAGELPAEHVERLITAARRAGVLAEVGSLP